MTATSVPGSVLAIGGMRDFGGELTFAPRLPARIERLAFRLGLPERLLKVEVFKTHATYRLLDGEPLELGHHGKAITVTTEHDVTEEIPPAESRPAPMQPPGRAPARRGTTDER